MRTTVDIDAPVLRDLKRLQKKTRKTLGRLISDLLSQALARGRKEAPEAPRFRWTAKRMNARVDLED